MGRLGADVDELARLARSLETAAETLSDDRRQVGTAVRRARWDGPDAERFRHDWAAAHGPSLDATARSFEAAARTLRAEVQAQRRASDGEGGSPVDPSRPRYDGGPVPHSPEWQAGDRPKDEVGILDDVSTVGGAIWDGFVTLATTIARHDPELFASMGGTAGRVLGGVGGVFSALGIPEGAADVVEGGRAWMDGDSSADLYTAADGHVSAYLSTVAAATSWVPVVGGITSLISAGWGLGGQVNGLTSGTINLRYDGDAAPRPLLQDMVDGRSPAGMLLTSPLLAVPGHVYHHATGEDLSEAVNSVAVDARDKALDLLGF